MNKDLAMPELVEGKFYVSFTKENISWNGNDRNVVIEMYVGMEADIRMSGEPLSI